MHSLRLLGRCHNIAVFPIGRTNSACVLPLAFQVPAKALLSQYGVCLSKDIFFLNVFLFSVTKEIQWGALTIFKRPVLCSSVELPHAKLKLSCNLSLIGSLNVAV